ncbi:ABC-2 type transport system ATP-binding protein [Lutibacter oceani]|uniref:ABC-2 type transport system ATP-binding protein n=1 Tax=Lutibacter oceani TaxID=1853311 RepID=A0A3D9RXA4_9FLAO|nr:ATP-binding cassette domain-containing protein [Lutibacter oceani]REE82234.1 ABC-2 type transport system ATP-binding protein [Lutibacter oceani]
MNTILTVENVCKNYGNFTALNNVSISVPKGSVFGLLGPNGAGKTSLIRIINQITLQDSGNIFLDGEPLKPQHVHQIGYLPEERGLYKSMKVGEQALYLAQLKGLSKSDAKKKLKYWFEKFEISDWWDKKIQELSKGMAQKVQFIVTVMHAPKLLIFDEPFSGFDPINANLIKDEILKLRDDGASIIFSTHRMESVEELCDYIALINKSNKILDGKLSEIKQEFKTNQFEVGLISTEKEQLLNKLNEHYKTEKSVNPQLDDELRLIVTLNNGDTSKDLIRFLNNKAQLNHFTEIIPSANDIFLKAVANNG